MNKANVLKLADFIEKSETYYQGKWLRRHGEIGSDCGTPACIAGHCLSLAVSEGYEYSDHAYTQGSFEQDCIMDDNGIFKHRYDATWWVENLFRRYLEVNDKDHNELVAYSPLDFALTYDETERYIQLNGSLSPTREIAVSVLRNFAETGEVDWVTPAKESVKI